MKVIITGGSGLVGTALTESLTADGHEVIILSRSPDKVQGLPAGASAVGWDARSADGWGHLANGADAIVNLAGESIAGNQFFPARWTAARKRRILQSRLDAGRAVVEAIKASTQKPKVLVQASAVGYYGVRLDEVADESHPPAGDFAAQVCHAWENSTEEVEALGVRRVVTRGGLPLTTKGGIFTRLALPFKLFAGGPIGDGGQYLAWILMQDYVRALRFLIEHEDARGPYNLTAPNPVTNKAFARTLGRVMRRPSFMPVPGFAMKLAFGEVAEVALGGQNVLPKRLLDAGFEFDYPDLEPALRTLLSR